MQTLLILHFILKRILQLMLFLLVYELSVVVMNENNLFFVYICLHFVYMKRI